MKAVLLMAYGTPRSIDEVEAYYTHIRGGKKPSAEEVDNLVERYKAIGGTSPLIEITERQRAGLESSLRSSGSETRVFSAMKHSHPFVPEGVRKAFDAGIDELMALVLAPHYSSISVGAYLSSVAKANENLPRKMNLKFVESWHDHPALVSAWKGRIEEAVLKIPGSPSLVFSAHSLPERILSQGDPYRGELIRTSSLVADAVGRKGWSFAFQSAGHTGEPWLGPDIVEHLESLRQKGESNFVIAPIGFVSDHLEILYDIDAECADWAKKSSSSLVRCRSLNDSKEMIDCLSSIVQEKGFM